LEQFLPVLITSPESQQEALSYRCNALSHSSTGGVLISRTVNLPEISYFQKFPEILAKAWNL